MVEIGIVPTKYGYVAVGLRKTLGKRDVLEIRSPIPVSEELKTRILGRLSREVAEYLDEVGRWEGIGWAAFFWSVVGGIALVADRIWQYSFRFILLYSWIRVWFLWDGVFLFLPFLAKFKHRWRAKRIRAFYENDNAIVIHQEANWPTLIDSQMSEIDFIKDMIEDWPELAPYYKQMLEVDPPWVFDVFPSTIWIRFRNWFLGQPIRLPCMVYFVGEIC